MHVQLTFAGDVSEISGLLSQLQTAEAIANAKPATETKSKAPRAAKAKDPEPVQSVAEVAPQASAPPPSAPPPETAVIPSDAEVQAALMAVNEKFGIDKALECLSKFGAKRGREITDAQKAPFVALCKQVIA